MHKKHILLSLCGITPQIITETLYALMILNEYPITEIWLVTTQKGKKVADQQLLTKENALFYRFCHEYHIDATAIEFDRDHILAFEQSEDIKNRQDSEAFANLITEKVWQLTRARDTVLHCSLAGGRKTMSAYLAMVMQFLARPQDQMYHVLVSPAEFENNPDFYYPPKRDKQIKTADHTFISTATVSLDLVNIPFIRLGSRIKEFQDKFYSFSEMVDIVQEKIQQPPHFLQLIIEPKNKQIRIGNQYKIRLPGIKMAVYRFLAEKSLNRPDTISPSDYERYFLKGGIYIDDEQVDRFRELYPKRNFKFDWYRLQQEISVINHQILDRELQNFDLKSYYKIYITGGYTTKYYGIPLDKKYITIL